VTRFPVAFTVVAVTLTGGPTVLLELGALRLLVDPTFDPPGEHPRDDVRAALCAAGRTDRLVERPPGVRTAVG
jgi:L-ascorbate metabolism protein UlaG (beta-lactamase superfamily)